MTFNVLCKHDLELWRAELPLICYYIMEWYLPNHVLRLFGKVQPVAVEHEATNKNLHM
jgi:hypothetical protein